MRDPITIISLISYIFIVIHVNNNNLRSHLGKNGLEQRFTNYRYIILRRDLKIQHDYYISHNVNLIMGQNKVNRKFIPMHIYRKKLVIFIISDENVKDLFLTTFNTWSISQRVRTIPCCWNACTLLRKEIENFL